MAPKGWFAFGCGGRFIALWGVAGPAGAVVDVAAGGIRLRRGNCRELSIRWQGVDGDGGAAAVYTGVFGGDFAYGEEFICRVRRIIWGAVLLVGCVWMLADGGDAGGRALVRNAVAD